jgi:S1-C subfamily serine protease
MQQCMGNSSLGQRQRVWQLFVVAPLMIIAAFAHAGSLSETIKKIKPSIVGIGTYQATRQPPAQLSGTGFAIGEGRHVITNAHVLPEVIDSKGKGERLTVFVGRGEKVDAVPARTVALDPEYDLAVLELERRTLPSLTLGNSSAVQEGRAIAFTGFPIGSVLGLHPVTHTGTVSAVTPIVTPLPNAGRLNPKLIRRLRRPYDVFQLDATAYPGNSGSPVFDPQSGEVLGVINKVFVQGTKEAVLENPSGITYAIPIDYAKALLRKKGIATGAR